MSESDTASEGEGDCAMSKMTKGKMEFIKSHECIKNHTQTAIEQYTDGNASHWYFNINNKLNGILYCPYCGKNLYMEELGEGTNTDMV